MSAGRELNTFDEFAGYRSGDRVGFFGKWRKSLTDTQGEAKVVLHMKRRPIILFQHQGLPRVKVYERDGVEVEELWGREDNCYTDEALLAKQYALDSSGHREVVSTVCAHCRLVAILGDLVRVSERERVLAAKARRAFDPTIGVPFYTPVFRFSARDAMDDKVLFAGPMVLGKKGMPQWKDLQTDVKDLVKQSRLNPKEVWGQDNHARKQCLFTLVGVAGNADADLSAATGVMVAMERGMLFDRMQSEIVAQHKRKQTGKNVHPKARERGDGDPWRVPYPFHWEYDKDEEIKDMYKVTALEEEISPEVRALIEGPPPDVSQRCRHFDQAKLRLFLEANAQIDLPWDEIFGRKNEKGKWVPLESASEDGDGRGDAAEGEGDEDASFNHGANAAPEVGRDVKAPEATKKDSPSARGVKPTKVSTGRPFPLPEDDVDNDENVILCDDTTRGCKKLMWSSDHTCPHCGIVWDQAAADVEKKAREALAAKQPVEEPKKRTRQRAPAAAPAAFTASAQPVEKSKGDDVGF